MDETLRRSLEERQFLPIVLTRHPLDVLISILQFVAHDDATQPWLDRRNDAEASIRHVSPPSRAFLAYATGPRARALLSVSLEWAPLAAHMLRYEDLVHAPVRTLTELVESLGIPPRAAPGEAIAENTLGALRDRFSQDYHFWQGKPGLWRMLLPATAVRDIQIAHAAIFRRLNYDCVPDAALTAEEADRRWNRLELESLRRSAATNRAKATKLQMELADAHATLAERHELVLELDKAARDRERALAQAQKELASVHNALAEQHARIAELDQAARHREQLLVEADLRLRKLGRRTRARRESP